MRSARLVVGIHFEDFPGPEFERLCFAYSASVGEWRTIEWYGQLGGDSGRDIWGVRATGETVCYQCANHQQLKAKKVLGDIGKVCSGPGTVPDSFVLMCGHKVSANVRDRAKRLATAKGIKTLEIWSGAEVEERLRRDAPLLLKRFVEGELFPEKPEALRTLGAAKGEMADSAILALIAECFDRPAFFTPFRDESSIPDFRKAITDTIEVLNTGVRRLRDGTEIGRIPSRHQIKDSRNKTALAKITNDLVELRSTFDHLVNSGDVQPCQCGKPDCPVLMVNAEATHEMDRLRRMILAGFSRVYPSFDPMLPPR